MSLAFLGAAGFLAWSAQEAAYSDAFQSFERKRLPSEKAWKHALGSRGFSPPREEKLLHQALRKLPTTLDRAGSVWIDPQGTWIAVFQWAEGSGLPHLFCEECKNLPKSWDPVGIGWTGFDQVLDRIDRAAAHPHALPKRKLPQFRDPRQILY